MKKINVKKLNAFMMNQSNAIEVRSFVQDCVHIFLHDEPKPAIIAFLNDHGLLMEA